MNTENKKNKKNVHPVFGKEKPTVSIIASKESVHGCMEIEIKKYGVIAFEYLENSQKRKKMNTFVINDNIYTQCISKKKTDRL